MATERTKGAAKAIRVAATALQAEASELRETIDQLDEILAEHDAAHEVELEELRDEIENLKTAMLSRASIEQAKGLLIGTNHCTPDEAFDILRKASQRENVKLHDIALRIVENAIEAAP